MRISSFSILFILCIFILLNCCSKHDPSLSILLQGLKEESLNHLKNHTELTIDGNSKTYLNQISNILRVEDEKILKETIIEIQKKYIEAAD